MTHSINTMSAEELYAATQNRLNELAFSKTRTDDEVAFLHTIVLNLKQNDPECKIARMYLPYLEHFNLQATVDELDQMAKSKDLTMLFSDMKYRKMAIETTSSVMQSIMTRYLKEHDGMLYVVTPDDGYIRIGQYNPEHLVSFAKACIDDRTSRKTYLLNDEIKKIAAAVNYYVKSIDQTKNYIIQFNDCYLKDGKVYKGTSPVFPRYFITRKVYHAVQAYMEDGTMPQPNEVTGTAMDLALHIANYDKRTFHRLLAASSMIFLNDLDKRAKFARFIRLYGPTGANGKSEFQKLMARIVQEDNFTPFKASDFDDQFKTGKIATALLAIESEDEGKMSANAASQLKLMVTGDPLTYREIRQAPEKSRAIATVFSNSNMMLNTSDKSDAFARRLDWFKVEEKYTRAHRGQIHFDNLRTEETSQFMTEYLLVTMLKTLENNDLPEKSQQMIDTDKEFTSNNDSAQDFVEEVGLHTIIGYSVTEVRKRYEEWCELNSRIELKQKFNTALESKFGLTRRKLGKDLINPESDSFGLIESGTIRQISGWMTNGARDSYDFNKLDSEGNVEVQMGVLVGSSNENRTTLTELFGISDMQKEPATDPELDPDPDTDPDPDPDPVSVPDIDLNKDIDINVDIDKELDLSEDFDEEDEDEDLYEEDFDEDEEEQDPEQDPDEDLEQDPDEDLDEDPETVGEIKHSKNNECQSRDRCDRDKEDVSASETIDATCDESPPEELSE